MKRVTEDELKALKHNTALVEKYDRAMIQVRTALRNQEKLQKDKRKLEETVKNKEDMLKQLEQSTSSRIQSTKIELIEFKALKHNIAALMGNENLENADSTTLTTVFNELVVDKKRLRMKLENSVRTNQEQADLMAKATMKLDLMTSEMIKTHTTQLKKKFEEDIRKKQTVIIKQSEQIQKKQTVIAEQKRKITELQKSITSQILMTDRLKKGALKAMIEEQNAERRSRHILRCYPTCETERPKVTDAGLFDPRIATFDVIEARRQQGFFTDLKPQYPDAKELNERQNKEIKLWQWKHGWNPTGPDDFRQKIFHTEKWGFLIDEVWHLMCNPKKATVILEGMTKAKPGLLIPHAIQHLRDSQDIGARQRAKRRKTPAHKDVDMGPANLKMLNSKDWISWFVNLANLERRDEKESWKQKVTARQELKDFTG